MSAPGVSATDAGAAAFPAAPAASATATGRPLRPGRGARRRGRQSPAQSSSSWRWHLLLVPLALVMAAPLLWMLVTSLSTLADSLRYPPGLPSSPQWSNYVEAWADSPFPRWLLNSAVVSGTCVVSNLVLCTLAGYAFARVPFPLRGPVFAVLLATLAVPFQVTMIPTLIIVRALHLIDSLPALIAPNLVTVFGVFLLRQFFLSVPVELEEAALLDGAGRLTILRRVLLPLMTAPLSTLTVLTFLATWNDFLWPLLVNSSPEVMTVQLGLASFQGSHFTNWPLLMAGTVISQVPVLVLFVLAQRYFVRSLAATGLK